MDLEDTWLKLGEASREVMEESAARPGDVLGLASTSMRNTTVLLDRDDRALLAAPNQDARALGEALSPGGGARDGGLHSRGHSPSPIFMGSRLLWLKEHAPGQLEQTWRVASLSDWVAYRLAGELLAERSQAGETLLFDHHARDWDFGIIESLGAAAGFSLRRWMRATASVDLSAETAASYLGLGARVYQSRQGAQIPRADCSGRDAWSKAT